MFKHIYFLILFFCFSSILSAKENECFPPCRSGFLCYEGICIEKCNPPCPQGYKCNDLGECINSKVKNSYQKSISRIGDKPKKDSTKKVRFFSENIRFWGNSGFGPSTIQYANGGTISVEYKRLLLSLYTDYNWEWTLLEQREQANAIGLAAGVTFYQKYLTLSISTGPSFVWGNRLGNIIPDSGGFFSTDKYEEIEFHTIGLSVRSGIIFTPLPFLGIGLQGWGDVNRDLSYAGFMGCLYIGKLRK